jgi:RNA polymerase sigma-70 factor (ECF subfamily)
MEDPRDITKTIELVRRAQGGDAVSLDRLIARYYERVRSIVRMRLGAKLRGNRDSGDILQDTFAVAVQKFDQFEMRHEASLINWLARLAEHQITDAAAADRAKKRDRGREVRLDGATDDSAVGAVPDPASRSPPPVDVVIASEDRRAVEARVGELPEEYRELVILRDYAGYAWKEIAELTGSPSPDAARMKHAHAMLLLAKKLR